MEISLQLMVFQEKTNEKKKKNIIMLLLTHNFKGILDLVYFSTEDLSKLHKVILTIILKRKKKWLKT